MFEVMTLLKYSGILPGILFWNNLALWLAFFLAYILWHCIWQGFCHWLVNTWNCNAWARLWPGTFHIQTYQTTVFRRTLPAMLGNWHKHDFQTGSVIFIPFFLLHMHVHGVGQSSTFFVFLGSNTKNTNSLLLWQAESTCVCRIWTGKLPKKKPNCEKKYQELKLMLQAWNWHICFLYKRLYEYLRYFFTTDPVSNVKVE